MRDQHEAAGKAVKLKTNLAPENNGRDISGREFIIEDWAENVFGVSWMAMDNFAATNYASRVVLSNLATAMGSSKKYIPLPFDNDVLYGKINGLGFCVHRLEIDDSVLP